MYYIPCFEVLGQRSDTVNQIYAKLCLIKEERFRNYEYIRKNGFVALRFSKLTIFGFMLLYSENTAYLEFI